MDIVVEANVLLYALPVGCLDAFCSVTATRRDNRWPSVLPCLGLAYVENPLVPGQEVLGLVTEMLTCSLSDALAKGEIASERACPLYAGAWCCVLMSSSGERIGILWQVMDGVRAMHRNESRHNDIKARAVHCVRGGVVHSSAHCCTGCVLTRPGTVPERAVEAVAGQVRCQALRPGQCLAQQPRGKRRQPVPLGTGGACHGPCPAALLSHVCALQVAVARFKHSKKEDRIKQLSLALDIFSCGVLLWELMVPKEAWAEMQAWSGHSDISATVLEVRAPEINPGKTPRAAKNAPKEAKPQKAPQALPDHLEAHLPAKWRVCVRVVRLACACVLTCFWQGDNGLYTRMTKYQPAERPTAAEVQSELEKMYKMCDK